VFNTIVFCANRRTVTAPSYGKNAVLASLAISVKCGLMRDLPGGLRRERKTGVFVPRLRDKAAGLGDFAGKTRWNRCVLAGNDAKNAKKRTRLSGTGRRGLPPTVKSAEARLPPGSSRLAAPKPGNGR
jgi:hypothetical protein